MGGFVSCQLLATRLRMAVARVRSAVILALLSACRALHDGRVSWSTKGIMALLTPAPQRG